MGSLTLHHLQLSQSERIVWLLTELAIPHNLITYPRDPQRMVAPDSLKMLHPAGTAPVLVDDSVTPPVTLAESGAIVEYVLSVHGHKSDVKLAKQPGEQGYADYVQWLHFANGSLFPAISRAVVMLATGGGAKGSEQMWSFGQGRVNTALRNMDAQLSSNKFLAGEELTAADIMTVFTITTMRGFAPGVVELGGYDNVLRYLQDVGRREGYRKAMARGDPDLEPCLQETLNDEQKNIFNFPKTKQESNL